MTRLYLPDALAVGATVTLPESAARHAVQVLRLREGANVTLFDGRGGEYAARLTTVAKREVTATVVDHHPVERESSLTLTLAQCVSKGDRMDYTVQKAVELGVTHIVPLTSERTVVRLDAERWARRHDHWQGVIAGACEQSGRNRLPLLAPVQTLDAWLSTANGLRLVLDPAAGGALRQRAAPSSGVSLLVGPEGGLSDIELTAARAAGCEPLALGPRVLRTETAGVAALAAIQALWGDLG